MRFILFWLIYAFIGAGESFRKMHRSVCTAGLRQRSGSRSQTG
jgi:hypothetical protein